MPSTLRSIVGHPGLAAYVAIAENECLARTKFEMVEVSSREMHLAGTLEVKLTKDGSLMSNRGCSNLAGKRRYIPAKSWTQQLIVLSFS